jgi:hypothetical protein
MNNRLVSGLASLETFINWTSLFPAPGIELTACFHTHLQIICMLLWHHGLTFLALPACVAKNTLPVQKNAALSAAFHLNYKCGSKSRKLVAHIPVD